MKHLRNDKLCVVRSAHINPVNKVVRPSEVEPGWIPMAPVLIATWCRGAVKPEELSDDPDCPICCANVASVVRSVYLPGERDGS